MAVYTNIDNKQVEQFLLQYQIGTLQSIKGIAEGVENSNFLLVTSHGQYILTLYEKRVEEADLPFFLGLMEHLAKNGFTCPTPIPMKNGESLSKLAGKSAAIIQFLNGISIADPDVVHCEMMGKTAARLHQIASSFSNHRTNALSQHSWRELFEKSRSLADTVEEGLTRRLDHELDYQNENWPDGLPSGVIHADLFPDNVFFLDGKLSGVIDYYFSANDYWALDLAICINAWCFEKSGEFNFEKSAALLRGYQSVRALEKSELEALPTLCRGGALRFLLTRLHDWLNVPPGALVIPHDPREYVEYMKFHQSIKTHTQYFEPENK